jgi:hypothetical protein
MEFTVALAKALAWPIVVLALMIAFRRVIAKALGSPLKRLSILGGEAEWQTRMEAASESLVSLPEHGSKDEPNPSLDPESLPSMLRGALEDPRSAIFAAETSLNVHLGLRMKRLDNRWLADPWLEGSAASAFKSGRISYHLHRALQQIAAMYRLTARGEVEIGGEKVLEFLALAAVAQAEIDKELDTDSESSR